MANDPKVRALYEDFYQGFGASAAWTPPAKMRVYRDRLPALMQQMRRSPESKAKLARVVNKTPEVMVKVTGRTYGSGHLGEHMNYITRNGKVAAETEYGMMKGKEAVRDLHKDWTDDEKIYAGQRQVRQAPLSVNMVLSMPPGVDREKFRNAVRDFVEREITPRSEAMVAFHDDTQHPHAHVTVRGRQHNGRAFNPGKPVLERYREQFASALRERGIEAEATPRYSRGRTMKAERQNMRHMRAKGLTPRNVNSAMSDVYREITQRPAQRQTSPGEGERARPWERAARDRHAGVQSVYGAAARELAASPERADQRLAMQVAAYAKAMPEPQFRHGLFKEVMQSRMQQLGGSAARGPVAAGSQKRSESDRREGREPEGRGPEPARAPADLDQHRKSEATRRRERERDRDDDGPER
ncbi:relaxase/mobilization nuclease domain-containing protein [Aureimonas altamirensis]|uniref:relaxase/mobilization nuclease domain-containing protein n=1 Tax=Aureimonas altamirensis TaxID=370622 RepID=UPI002557A53D|nr:relaxase/mobilization nuclease domain-containing protein [Aureimonas altamirensis]